MRRICGTVALAALLVASTPDTFGGWAVVTVENMPEYLEAASPTVVSFKVRQHGQTLRDDLSPSLILRPANAGFLSDIFKKRRFVATTAPSDDGTYEATVVLPDSGLFSMVVATDIAGWKVKMLPIRVVASGRTPPPMTPYIRGRQLFVATGCITCHVKLDDPALADLRKMRVGPDLTNRVFDADWLVNKLTDPASYRVTVSQGVDMPDLGLGAQEIQALVSYINAEPQPVVTTDGV